MGSWASFDYWSYLLGCFVGAILTRIWTPIITAWLRAKKGPIAE